LRKNDRTQHELLLRKTLQFKFKATAIEIVQQNRISFVRFKE